MAGPDNRVERAKIRAEAQFKRAEVAQVFHTEVERQAAALREKTARLRAERLAREQAEAALPPHSRAGAERDVPG